MNAEGAKTVPTSPSEARIGKASRCTEANASSKLTTSARPSRRPSTASRKVTPRQPPITRRVSWRSRRSGVTDSDASQVGLTA